MITREQINEAAAEVRVALDRQHARIQDEDGGAAADEQTRSAYDAVTLLHEAAMEGRGHGS